MPKTTITITKNFEDNLDSLHNFLKASDAEFSFELLLDDLFEKVIPNLSSHPLIGVDFFKRRADSDKAIMKKEELKAKIKNAKLREYILDDYILLYSIENDNIYLLAIKHHRQLVFNLKSI